MDPHLTHVHTFSSVDTCTSEHVRDQHHAPEKEHTVNLCGSNECGKQTSLSPFDPNDVELDGAEVDESPKFGHEVAQGRGEGNVRAS